MYLPSRLLASLLRLSSAPDGLVTLSLLVLFFIAASEALSAAKVALPPFLMYSSICLQPALNLTFLEPWMFFALNCSYGLTVSSAIQAKLLEPKK